MKCKKACVQERFIETPHIPKSKITLAAVSNKYHYIIESLNKYNIKCIPILDNLNLSKPVQSHADMQLYHCEKNKIIISKELDFNLIEILKNQGFILNQIEKDLGSKYPNDILLNSARLGNIEFCKINCVNKSIIEYTQKNNIKLINVNQGYAKCSIAIVTSSAIITSDAGIANLALNESIDVLKIDAGHIKLDGYSYGFIGGTCGLIDKNKLAFIGNIKYHPQAKEIQAFCNKHNVDVVNLIDKELVDIGGILPLKETQIVRQNEYFV